MNKLLKVIFAASAVVAASASAQTMTEYMAKKPYQRLPADPTRHHRSQRHWPVLAYRLLDPS